MWCRSEHCVRLFVTPWTAAYQAPLSMGFLRQGYWSGLLFPSLGDLPDPGIEHWVFNVGLPHCRQTLCHLSHQGSQNRYQMRQSLLWGVKKGDLVWGCSVGSEVGFFLSSQNEWRLEYKNPWISGNVMLAVLLSAALNERFIHLFSHSKTIHWQCSRCQAMF